MKIQSIDFIIIHWNSLRCLLTIQNYLIAQLSFINNLDNLDSFRNSINVNSFYHILIFHFFYNSKTISTFSSILHGRIQKHPFFIIHSLLLFLQQLFIILFFHTQTFPIQWSRKLKEKKRELNHHTESEGD